MDRIDRIRQVWERFVDGLKNLTEEIERIFQQMEESGAFYIEPRARRWKRDRERARRIEQEYRAEIRRCERQRFYRRIYKPPSGNRRKNRQ